MTSYDLVSLKSFSAEVQSSVDEISSVTHPSLAVVVPFENCTDAIISSRSGLTGARSTTIGKEDGFGELLSGTEILRQSNLSLIPEKDCGFMIHYGCPEPKFLAEFKHRRGRRDPRVHRLILKENKVFLRGVLDHITLSKLLTALMGEARGFLPGYFGWNCLMEQSMQAISSSRQSIMFDTFEPWHVLLQVRPVRAEVPEARRASYERAMKGVQEVLQSGYANIPASLRSADYRNQQAKDLKELFPQYSSSAE